MKTPPVHLLLAFLALPAQPQDELPAPSRERFADWDARDAEGRWALLAADLALDPDAARRWVPFLAAEGALTELEWIAQSQPLAGLAALEALVSADAPSWPRAAGWQLAFADSHVREQAKQHLGKRPGLLLSWTEPHEAALSPPLRAFRDAVAEEHPGAPRPDAVAVARYLPPLAAEDVLAVLHAAAGAVPFGERLQSEGAVYEHQVERALHALEATTLRGAQERAVLLDLARHPSEGLARAALLAFTHFDPHEVPDEALLSTARGTVLAPALRADAFLASTYGYAPRVFARLHELALDPSDEHWSAALDRLGELGHGFTLEHLEGLRGAPLSAAQQAELDATLAALRGRAPALDRELGRWLPSWLELAAYADIQCAPIEAGLVRWTLDTVRAQLGDAEVRAELTLLRDSYESKQEVETLAGTLTDRVRLYAAQLLEQR